MGETIQSKLMQLIVSLIRKSKRYEPEDYMKNILNYIAEKAKKRIQSTDSVIITNTEEYYEEDEMNEVSSVCYKNMDIRGGYQKDGLPILRDVKINNKLVYLKLSSDRTDRGPPNTYSTYKQNINSCR